MSYSKAMTTTASLPHGHSDGSCALDQPRYQETEEKSHPPQILDTSITPRTCVHFVCCCEKNTMGSSDSCDRTSSLASQCPPPSHSSITSTLGSTLAKFALLYPTARTRTTKYLQIHISNYRQPAGI